MPKGIIGTSMTSHRRSGKKHRHLPQMTKAGRVTITSADGTVRVEPPKVGHERYELPRAPEHRDERR